MTLKSPLGAMSNKTCPIDDIREGFHEARKPGVSLSSAFPFIDGGTRYL